MARIKIIRSQQIEAAPLPGVGVQSAGWIKRVIYPPHVITKGSFLGVSEFNPGYSVHRWHNHIRDQAEGFEVVYPDNFEEIYYIVSGSGVIQWKNPEGTIEEEKVGPGDAMFMPDRSVEHQLFNNGSEKMVVIYCGCPPPQVTMKKK